MLKYKSGRWFGIVSLLMALASLFVAPIIFGTFGIAAGMVAVVKGERYLGMVGVIGSAVLGFIGYYIAILLIGG